jgi:hypothetical protein
MIVDEGRYDRKQNKVKGGESNLAQLPPVTRLFGIGHSFSLSLIAPEFQLTQRRSSWSIHQAYDILARAIEDVIRDQGDFARQGCSALNLDGFGILSWVLIPLFGRGEGEGNERDLHGQGGSIGVVFVALFVVCYRFGVF